LASGSRWRAAGTSWQDVSLYLVARFAAIDAAMQVARINS
jgi:hypothetical protein